MRFSFLHIVDLVFFNCSAFPHRGDVPAMVLQDFGSNGCQSSPTKQTITNTGFVTVRSSIVPVYRMQTTAPLAINCAASQMKDALETLSLVARVDVTTAVENNGYSWMVTFKGYSNATSAGIPPLYVNNVNAIAAISGNAYSFAVGEYIVGSLVGGQAYSASVAAVNLYGVGVATSSVPTSRQPSDQVPSPPLNLRVFVAADKSLSVQFNMASLSGGQPISSYRVQWDTDPAFNSGYRNAPLEEIDILSSATSGSRADVQIVSVVSQVGYNPSGTFVLAYLGQKTPELDYNISASGLKSALENLSTINKVDVNRQLFCSREAGRNNCGLERGYR